MKTLTAFDLDGTLITCEPRQSAVLRAAAAAWCHPVDTDAVWRLKRAGASTRDALGRCGLGPEVAARIADHWQKMVEEPFWLGLDRAFAGTESVLAGLQAKGAELILLTARSRPEWLAQQLRRLGLDRYFSSVECVPSTGVAHEKASRLRRSGATVYVGDTESDAAAAGLAGVRFIGVTSGQRSEEFLRLKGAETVVAGIGAAAGLLAS